jgi:hypothetical protein
MRTNETLKSPKRCNTRTFDNQRLVLLLFLVLFLAAALSIALPQSANIELAEELRQRGLAEGLALASTIAGNHWEIVPLSGEPRTIDNPRGLSGAWFDGSGRTVAWNIGSWPGEAFAECPSPVIVEASDGTQLWQLPGNVINSAAIAVSADGQRVAFDGTFKPIGTGFLNTTRNQQRWVTGLQLADRATNSVSLILPLKDSFDGTTPEHIGWISWSPDGNRFVYEFRDEIYVYDVLQKTKTALATGSNPVWSPDGKWIGFRSPTREAQIINPRTKESRTLIAGHKLQWGIHWSPDWAYVMFAEPRAGWAPLRSASTQLVVYRLRDGASTPVYEFGYTELGSDGGFFWVKDIQRFLKDAAVPPKIQPCQER